MVANFKVLPGFILVELEDLHGDGMVGEIYLPQIKKHFRANVGRILQANLRPFDLAHLGPVDMTGQRVLMDLTGGRHIEDFTYVYPALIRLNPEDPRPKYKPSILALLTDNTKVEVVDEMPRCQFCGEAKSGSGTNIILVQRKPADGPKYYYCPRCKRDQTGAKR